MDPIRNPFAPGAGARPPELVGRDAALEAVETAVLRAALGKSSRSQMMLGLRGTGKTVLLSHIAELNEERTAPKVWVVQIEAPEGGRLPALLFPGLRNTLRKLSTVEAAKQAAYNGMRALRGFASVFNVEIGGVSISVDPEPGVGDSGDLATDLTDIMIAIGRAARDAGGVFLLLIDEVQYLDETALSALVVALHRCSQKGLPVVFVGAGLPQVAGLAGEAKSYAERLFEYHDIGALDPDEARRALSEPIRDEGEQVTEDALQAVVAETEGYPYFLQEWGYHLWNIADASPMDGDDARKASATALSRLDSGFFKVRMDRLTPGQREYVHAMAALPGPGPYRSGDIAKQLGKSTQRLGPRRGEIIKKGMIYSPAHGDTAFTVPGFADYLRRTGYGENE